MPDAVVIGSGINGLVAGAMLALDGWQITVVEASDRLGGAIRTDTEVFDGYTVELMSSWHPLFVGGPAFAELEAELSRRGVTYLNTDKPTAVACADGTALLSTDPDATNAAFESLGDLSSWSSCMAEFGSKIDLAFGLLGTDFWRRSAAKFGWTAARRLGRRGVVASGAELLEPASTWLRRDFESPVSRALLAPWALHNGLGPDDASSAFITKVIAAALSQGGMPVPEGGGIRLVDALVGIITNNGGTAVTGTAVTAIEVDGKRVTGARLADDTVLSANTVLASVGPRALYEGLLGQAPGVPAEHVTAASKFTYGRAAMQIHLALSDPPAWTDAALGEAAIVHVLDGLDSVSASVNAAWRGHLPARPTVAVGQPLTVDPSRAPDGGGLLWLQLQELPREVRGDDAGSIDPGDGSWGPATRDAFAERAIDQLRPHITNLDAAIIDRLVLGPAELQDLNVNLVGGDPYGGDCRAHQFAAWRPLSSATGHATGIDGLWHIGASTHPGPGLGGGSGYLVASRLRDQRRRRRFGRRPTGRSSHG